MVVLHLISGENLRLSNYLMPNRSETVGRHIGADLWDDGEDRRVSRKGTV